MQWLSDLPFADNRMVQIGFLAACGLAGLVVLAILYRFVFANRLRVPGGRTRQPRLGLVDAFSLDGQRQLVLVRRDNVEHLIMIGGPNDVLVEGQINRALAAARENNMGGAAQSKPAPPRRADPPPAAPPAPAPPVPAAAPPAAKAPSSAPQSSAPAERVIRGEVRPIRPQNASSGQAPEASRPPAPVAPEPVAQPAPLSAPSKAHQPDAHPIQSQPQPRPLPARPAMPPPITPIAGTAGRAAVSHLPGKQIQPTPPVPSSTPVAQASVPDAASRSQPSPDERPTALPKELGRAASVAIPLAGSVKVAGTPVAPAAAAMTVKAEPRMANPKPQGADIPPPMDRHATSPGADPSIIEKPAPAKAQDPFGGLESLEAEMARLLGREK
jgi:flagellar protein FliO/FliZ